MVPVMTMVNTKIHLSSFVSLDSPPGTLQVCSSLEGTSLGIVSYVQVEAMEAQLQCPAHVVTNIRAVTIY